MPKRNPRIFVPTLYFAQGLPSTIVMLMSAVYLKNMGASNDLIGETSWLQLPWTLKFLGAPMVDFFGKKKQWILVAQLVLACLIAVLAGTTILPNPITFGIVAMGFIALASSLHDASIDGYYLEVLDKNQQALFVGVRNTSFRLSMIFGNGGMVWLAGVLSHQMTQQQAWMFSFGAIAVVMLMLFSTHSWYLPLSVVQAENSAPVSALTGPDSEPRTPASATDLASESSIAASADSLSSSQARPIQSAEARPDHNYIKAIFSYFDQPSIMAIVAYLLLFRLGDALCTKMIPAFLLDAPAKNGLGLTLEQIGMVSGTVGVACLLLGGIIGGYLVSKQGLKRWIWPATLLMDSTILLYWLLATYRPASMVWVYLVNSMEQFGYGFGMAAYTVFMLTTVKKEYKAAHYAVATAFMSLGLMAPGAKSGDIHLHLLGASYAKFFLLSFFLTIPGMISIFFLPIWKKDPDGSASS